MTPTQFELPISRNFNVTDQLTVTVIACLCLRKHIAITPTLLCHTDALIEYLQSHDAVPLVSEANVLKALATLRIENSHTEFSLHIRTILDLLVQHQSQNNIIDLCISQFTDYSRGSKMFFQNPQLTKLICSITQAEHPCKIYNPFAGLGSFATGIPACEYHGDEFDPYIWALGVLRLEYYGISSEHYTINDSIKNWNATNDKFDLIITNPPINIDDNVISHVTLDEMIIDKSYTSLSNTGTLLFVCSSAYIHEQVHNISDNTNHRKALFDKKHLRAIYEIPADSSMYQYVNPAKPRYLVHLDLRAAHDDITFYITPEQYSSTHITLDQYRQIAIPIQDIIDNNYDLNGRRYLQKQVNDQRIAQEQSMTYLRDLLEIFVAPYPKENISNAPMFTSKNLAPSAFNYTVSPDSLATSSKEPNKMRCLTTPTLVCARLYNKIKPTYIQASKEHPVYLRGNYFTCALKDKEIELDYLVYALNTPDATNQFKALSSNGVIPSIQAKDFLDICIPLPSQKEQRRIVADALQAEIGKLGVEINRIEGAYLNMLRERKHAMGQEIMQIRSKVDRIFTIIKRKGQLSIDTVVDAKTNATAADYQITINKNIDDLGDMIQTMLDENHYGSPITIPLVNYFKEHCKKHKGDTDFSWELIEEYSNNTSTPLGPCVEIPLRALDVIMLNITENARKYGFTSKERQDYKIRILITEDEEDTICVRITNNGQPLDKSVNKNNIFQDGLTTGKGSGIGAWQIKNVMNKYGTDVQVIDDPKAEFPFGYNLLFENKRTKQ